MTHPTPHPVPEVARRHADGSLRRSAECALRNPGNDETHQACCRFSKTCSPYPYDETPVTEADLEPRRGTGVPTVSGSEEARGLVTSETGVPLTVEEAARYYAWALNDRDPYRRGFARGLAAALATSGRAVDATAEEGDRG